MGINVSKSGYTIIHSLRPEDEEMLKMTGI
jgi:hypothetical protein